MNESYCARETHRLRAGYGGMNHEDQKETWHPQVSTASRANMAKVPGTLTDHGTCAQITDLECGEICVVPLASDSEGIDTDWAKLKQEGDTCLGRTVFRNSREGVITGSQQQ